MDNQDPIQKIPQDPIDSTNANDEKVRELENNWKRALADYKNLQKRSEEEKQDLVLYANQNIIYKLLFVLDSLGMLETHINDVGLGMITKEFRQILKDEGVEEVYPEGELFDERTMDAVEVVEGKNDHVVEVLQRGYKYKSKILRPAKVKVGKEGGK